MVDEKTDVTEEPKGLIDEFLAEVLPEGEVGAEIVLRDPGAVDYQIQRIARLKAKQDEIVAFTKKQVEELLAYQDLRLETLQKEIDWRSGPLEVYVRDVHRKSDGKTKSLDLPHGKLKLIKQPDKYELEEGIVLNWIEIYHPDLWYRLCKITVSVRKDEIKKFIKETGELPDGVVIEPVGEPKFHLELK